MARIGSQVTSKTAQLLSASGGLSDTVANLQAADDTRATMPLTPYIRTQNAAADLVEQGEAARYPMVLVYCEKVTNSLIEKFRTFSGTVQMTAEVRYSQDRIQGVQQGLELCTDAVAQLLDANRGDWGSGMYYAGGYQVTYGPVKHGGKNYIQVAKVTFEIGVSIN